MKKIIYLFIGIVLAIGITVAAAPTQTFQVDLFPQNTNQYLLGSSTRQWLRVSSQNASTTNATISGTAWINNEVVTTSNIGTLTISSLAVSPLIVGGSASSTIYGNGESSIFPNVVLTNATTTTFRASGLATFGGNVGIGIINPSQSLTLSSTGILGWDNGSGTADVGFGRIAADVLAVKSLDTIPQELRICGNTACTYYMGNRSDGTNGYFNAAGSGGKMFLQTQGTSWWAIEGINGNLYPNNAISDNTQDFGLSANRIRNGYFGTSLNSPLIWSNSPLTASTTGANPLIFATNSSERVRIDSTGNLGIASTSPISLLTVSGDIATGGNPPTLSSCGTSPTIRGTDTAGEVTVGSVAASGCTITFAAAKTYAPTCTVTNQSASVVNAMTYTISTSAITVTQTALTSAKINYSCFQMAQ